MSVSSRAWLLLAPTVFFAGCSTTTGNDIPRNVSLIPAGSLKLSPSIALSYEKLALTAAGAALAYTVYDPLAPNWEIEEAPLGEDRYLLSMKMKRFHTGGDGEALPLFKRRALQLQAARGFSAYRIVEYVEGIESSTLAAQRYSQGVIQLVHSPG